MNIPPPYLQPSRPFASLHVAQLVKVYLGNEATVATNTKKPTCQHQSLCFYILPVKPLTFWFYFQVWGTPLYPFYIFPMPLGYFYSRHFSDAKTEKRAMGRFHRDLRVKKHCCSIQRIPSSPGFTQLLQCFLSVLDFPTCLKDLPAHAISMTAWHALWHGRCDTSRSCKAEETTCSNKFDKNNPNLLTLSNANCCGNLWLGRPYETELFLLGTGMLS